MYNISSSYPLFLYCLPFVGIIGFILGIKMKKQSYVDDYQCLGCRTRISARRIIPSKDKLVLQNPEYMDKACIKCNQKNEGIYRDIHYFCKPCYDNRINCYICDFCFRYYVDAYRLRVYCGITKN